MLGVPLLFATLGGGFYWFVFGGGRRHLGIAVMVFAAVLLAVVTIASCDPLGGGAVVLLPGIVISVAVGWLGYKLRGWIPPEPPPEPILAAARSPTPTTRTLSPADVLGQWRFYVDAAFSTITIDLQSGGHYRQIILGNSSKHDASGEGEWSLDGPNLELSVYRSATQGETARVRWFFGDCESGLILFAKDDPQTESMLVARRSANSDALGESPFGNETALRAKQTSRRAGSSSPSLFADHGSLGRGAVRRPHPFRGL